MRELPLFKMKSSKPVKKLDEIVLPLKITPKQTIKGGVNGVKFFFPAGKTVEISVSEYETLINSGYGDSIEN